MNFKRNSTHNQGFNYGARATNPGNVHYGAHAGFPNFTGHHPHSHNVRGFKPDMHSGRLNLVHSYGNLSKMYGEMSKDRELCFRMSLQHREIMFGQISSISSALCQDDFLDLLLSDLQSQIDMIGEEEIPPLESPNADEDTEQSGSLQTGSIGTAQPKDQPFVLRKTSEVLENAIKRIKTHRQDAINQITEEIRICATREQSFVDAFSARERRFDKDLIDFFTDTDRQFGEYEKKLRSENYGQVAARLKHLEREISLREQKIMQLEDTVKVVNERCEKFMAELQQINADHQFEKLQLYHQVEVCKVNAKCLAMEELTRLFKWKHCVCGRNYDQDLLREIEVHFNNNGFGCNNQQEPFGRCLPPNAPERKDMQMHVGAVWNLPLPTSSSNTSFHTAMSQPPAPTIPTGSFIPSEEAANKGVVINDLRERYDELQLKAAVVPNYEEVRTMIMKIVCHFRPGRLTVCEEMSGKKFVSSLFYCNEGDLVPTVNDNIFSSGYGETPEEATARSVKKAYDEIQRIENLSTSAEESEMELTYVRRGCNKNDVKGKPNKEPIRMTLVRSYCNEKLDPVLPGKNCFQEAHLYKNIDNTKDNFMADWKIHVRVNGESLFRVKEKLSKVFSILGENHVGKLIDPVIDEQKANKEKEN